MSWVRIISIAIPSFLLLFGLLWLFGLRNVRAGNEIIYNSPVSSIRSIQIQPEDLANNRSLITQNITITNAETIQQIMTAIRSAQSYHPNHDPGVWSCKLVISTSSGGGTLSVVEASEGGAIIGESLSPSLDGILKKIAEQQGMTNQWR
jgi:hypothetical protein